MVTRTKVPRRRLPSVDNGIGFMHGLFPRSPFSVNQKGSYVGLLSLASIRCTVVLMSISTMNAPKRSAQNTPAKTVANIAENRLPNNPLPKPHPATKEDSSVSQMPISMIHSSHFTIILDMIMSLSLCVLFVLSNRTILGWPQSIRFSIHVARNETNYRVVLRAHPASRLRGLPLAGSCTVIRCQPHRSCRKLVRPLRKSDLVRIR